MLGVADSNHTMLWINVNFGQEALSDLLIPLWNQHTKTYYKFHTFCQKLS